MGKFCLFFKQFNFNVACSDDVHRVIDSNRVTLGNWVVSHILFWSFIVTRVTMNDSRFESESSLQNLQTSYGQTLLVCMQRTETFLLQ